MINSNKKIKKTDVDVNGIGRKHYRSVVVFFWCVCGHRTLTMVYFWRGSVHSVLNRSTVSPGPSASPHACFSYPSIMQELALTFVAFLSGMACVCRFTQVCAPNCPVVARSS